MNNLWLLSGIVVFFASIIGGRVLTGRAVRCLDDAQKEALANGFAAMRWLQLIPIGVLLLLLLVLRRMGWLAAWRLELFGVGVALTFVAVHVRILLLLRKVGVPRDYTRAYLLARAMVAIGLLFWVLALWKSGQFNVQQQTPAESGTERLQIESANPE